MSWKDRLRPSILFVSPGGREFTADWAGNQRNVEKKLGIFEFPGIRGAQVQDLDVGADIYPLTFYFEGDDNDIIAESFFEACKENGQWTVTHPVKGVKSLQLIRATENIQPVTSGNITLIDSEWIEPINPSLIASTTELASGISNQSIELMDKALEQFEDVVELDTPSKITALKNAVDEAVTTVENGLKQLSDLSSEVKASVQSVIRGINDAIDAVEKDVGGIGGGIQSMVFSPSQTGADAFTVFGYYQDLVSSLSDDQPDIPTAAAINDIAVKELIMTTIIAVNSEVILSEELTSREQAVQLIESVANDFNNITTALDASQEIYQDNIIDEQYFSQSQSYNDAVALISITQQYLLRKSFDLAAARRFTLTRNRCPVEIAADKYGDYEHLDFFIESNNLKGNDILLIPAGREVVVYL